jgi:hypothetical protein
MSLHSFELLSDAALAQLNERDAYNELQRMRGLILQFRLYAGGLEIKLERIRKLALQCAAEAGEGNIIDELRKREVSDGKC